VLSCGDRVRIANGALNGIEAMMGRSSGSMIKLLAPLLGGARVRVSSARAVRARAARKIYVCQSTMREEDQDLAGRHGPHRSIS
jgi:hypothetical protein